MIVAAAEVDVAFGEKAFNALAQSGVRFAVEVVARLEAGERLQPPRQVRQRVDVDIPAVASVFEVVMHRRAAQMCDARAVERRCQHGTTSLRRLPLGHVAPRCSAARSPDAAPSSWNPHPW